MLFTVFAVVVRECISAHKEHLRPTDRPPRRALSFSPWLGCSEVVPYFDLNALFKSLVHYEMVHLTFF